MTNRPAYTVEAVDHTLAVLGLLTERETVRLTELASELGIGRATAHRLLQMLVYREFARQRPDRAYTAGPALMAARRQARLRSMAFWLRPSLLLAYNRLRESVELQVLSGIDVLSLDTIERPPGDRRSVPGTRLPAERTSGGLALLAQLPADEIRTRFGPLPALTRSQLDRSLAATLREGFGYVRGTDDDSVGVPVLDDDDQAIAALTCTAPRARLTRPRLAEVVSVLRAVAESARRARPATGSPKIDQRRTG